MGATGEEEKQDLRTAVEASTQSAFKKLPSQIRCPPKTSSSAVLAGISKGKPRGGEKSGPREAQKKGGEPY